MCLLFASICLAFLRVFLCTHLSCVSLVSWSAVVVSCWCRAGQELGPSAALLPIKDALASLQSSLQTKPSGNPLDPGPVIQDLLEQLSQAALFHELCSGDLQAVPGLMTPGSRLTCLIQLLQDEASDTPASSGADSQIESEAASVGSGESSPVLPGGLTTQQGSISCVK